MNGNPAACSTDYVHYLLEDSSFSMYFQLVKSTATATAATAIAIATN